MSRRRLRDPELWRDSRVRRLEQRADVLKAEGGLRLDARFQRVHVRLQTDGSVRVLVDQRAQKLERVGHQAAATRVSASRMRSSPEISLGRRVSRRAVRALISIRHMKLR